MADPNKEKQLKKLSDESLEKAVGGVAIENVKKIQCCKCKKAYPADQMRYEDGWMCPPCWNKYWGF